MVRYYRAKTSIRAWEIEQEFRKEQAALGYTLSGVGKIRDDINNFRDDQNKDKLNYEYKTSSIISHYLYKDIKNSLEVSDKRWYYIAYVRQWYKGYWANDDNAKIPKYINQMGFGIHTPILKAIGEYKRIDIAAIVLGVYNVDKDERAKGNLWYTTARKAIDFDNKYDATYEKIYTDDEGKETSRKWRTGLAQELFTRSDPFAELAPLTLSNI